MISWALWLVLAIPAGPETRIRVTLPAAVNRGSCSSPVLEDAARDTVTAFLMWFGPTFGCGVRRGLPGSAVYFPRPLAPGRYVYRSYAVNRAGTSCMRVDTVEVQRRIYRPIKDLRIEPTKEEPP